MAGQTRLKSMRPGKHVSRRTGKHDYGLDFQLTIFVALFGSLATLLTVRFLVGKRFEKIERERQLEEETRQTAESNSGL